MLYTITFPYATFASNSSGRYDIIAIDYVRYVIVKICHFQSNKY
jgi:hypothetical protein